MTTQLTITEPPGGWKSFVDQTWGQRSELFKDFSAPLLSADELFELLVKISRSESTHKISDKAGFTFYVEHTRLSNPWAYLLPESEDQSVQGYADRVNRLLDNRDFTLVVNNTQAFDFETWNMMRRFVSGLYSHIGLPLRAEVMIYLSHAGTTSVGVHRDLNSNFLFQVFGKKRFLMWPSKVFVDNPHLVRAHDVTDIPEAPIVADLNPGDLLYMPSDYYHMADCTHESETHNRLSVHVSFLIGAESQIGYHRAMRLILPLLKQRLDAVGMNPFVQVDGTNPRERSLPTPLASILETVGDLDKYLHPLLVEESLRLVTAFGCEFSPPFLNALRKLGSDDWLEMDPDSITASQTFSGTLYFVSNGHGLTCPAHPLAIDLIEQLTKPGRHKVDSLLQRFSGIGRVGESEVELRQQDIKSMLERMYCLGAVRVVNSN